MPLTRLPGANELLWHYTPEKNLEKIAESKVLFATDVQHTNDPSEYAYLVERMQADYDAARRKVEVGEGDISTAYDLHRILSSKDRKLQVRVEEGPAPFVTSFSTFGNLLPQWKIYTADACTGSTSGYALGFRQKDLHRIAIDNGGDLYGVYYLAAEENSPVRRAVDRGDVKIPDRMAAWIKHPDYCHEQEARIVIPQSGNHDLPPVENKESRPRIRLKLEMGSGEFNSPIPISPKALRVGPGPGQAARGDRARAILNEYGWAETEVIYSETPVAW